MRQIDKNTVAAANQLKVKIPIFYDNKDGKGKRVLFVGNSITLHGYKPEIGWYGEDYGMAASDKEKDYVHRVMQEIRKDDPDAACCILQAAEWERNYQNGSALQELYQSAQTFQADIIVMRIVENCPGDHFDSESFAREYKALIDFLNITGSAEIIVTTSFWKHVADDTILQIGRERGYTTVYMGELGEDESMKAIGKFEHSGVANHPGDLGMEKIAEMITAAIK